METDDDSNGEVDINEFLEALNGIDSRLYKRDLEKVYSDCVFTANSELKIHSFIAILRKEAKPRRGDRPADIIRRAFPTIFSLSSSQLLPAPPLVNQSASEEELAVFFLSLCFSIPSHHFLFPSGKTQNTATFCMGFAFG